jgi:hypothetical protein
MWGRLEFVFLIVIVGPLAIAFLAAKVEPKKDLLPANARGLGMRPGQNLFDVVFRSWRSSELLHGSAGFDK